MDFSVADGIFSIQQLNKDNTFSRLGDYVVRNGSNTGLSISYIDTDPIKASEQLKSILGTNCLMSPKGDANPVMTQEKNLFCITRCS
ncbi:MAG: hypothetical protein KatS3mg084_0181 [Candidatus Dojkabacteria bacterium]|nr:MAG: hypothetical protein KatS3mg084_0181 [Candidatus Dojkabacteria bacterium]